MKKICSLLVLCATVVFASCSKDDPVTDPVPEGVTTPEALLEALRTGGASADAPTLVRLGGDITIPVGTGTLMEGTPMTGNGYFKIDGGGHTLAWEKNSCYFLGNDEPDDDIIHIELANIELVQDMMQSASGVCVYNGRITLSGDVILNGPEYMVMAVREKAALELGDGCELSYATGTSNCAGVVDGSTLVLNGGKTTTGSYIVVRRNTSPATPILSVPKALAGDVHLTFSLNGAASIAQGIGGYQLTQADCDRLKVDPESLVSLYGEQMGEYGDKFELYLDPVDLQIKLRRKFITIPTSGDIDMSNMTAGEVKAAIEDALYAGFTELKLTGELSKIGMGGTDGTFVGNTKMTKCNLAGVTGWTDATLPDRAFMRCTALQEVVLPDGVQVIGEYAFLNCSALTTVNLSQITRIDETAFRDCASLTALTLDNTTAIGLDAFWGCTGLQTLKLPKCTRFGNYIVTGCKALTRIEAVAAGDFLDIDGNGSIINYAVFQNRGSFSGHTGENAFNPGGCNLVLNTDKQENGTAAPTVSNGNEWTHNFDVSAMIWKSITFE